MVASMNDVGDFQACAEHCRSLLRTAKRAEVKKALRCLVEEYEGKARESEAKTARRLMPLPFAWLAWAIHFQMTALLRVALAFSAP
jgi:hypothetical protein